MRRALFILLLLCGLSFADDLGLAFGTCTVGIMSSPMYASYQTGMEWVAIAIFISLFLAILAYMISRLTNDAHLLLFSKDLLTQTVISALLVIFTISIFEGSCVFTQQFLGKDGDPMKIATDYSKQLMFEGKMIVKSLYKESIDEKFKGAELIGFFAPFVGGETSFTGAFHNAFSRQCELLIDMVMVGFVSSGIQYYALNMIRDFVFPILVPFGLLLRTLPFLREAGNTILALGFTLFVILPFAYAVNSAAYDISPVCDAGGGSDIVLGDCNGIAGWGSIASYLLQTIFLPELAVVVTITAAGAMVKVAKVLP